MTSSLVETFSIADQMAIDALPEETRAIVERYARSKDSATKADMTEAVADEIASEIAYIVRRVVRNRRT